MFVPGTGQMDKKQPGRVHVCYIRPLMAWGKGAFIPGLYRRLKEFDIVHLHYPFFGGSEIVWLAKLLAGNRWPLFIHYHMDVAGLPLLVKLLSWPALLIRSSLFRIADGITCASLDYVKNSRINKYYLAGTSKFRVIPFGVDIKQFRPLDTASLTKQKQLDAPTILFVGGLDQAHYFKGVEVLLGAMAKLLDLKWTLKIVGDGNLRPHYQKRANRLGLGKRTCFLGRLDETSLSKAYAQADLFVLPSINKNEAYGMVLLEAMASSLPVVASDLPGVRSVFTHGQHGLLCQVGNVDSLSQAIERLLVDKNLRRQMGRAGRKLVSQRNSWAEAAKKLEAFYLEYL